MAKLSAALGQSRKRWQAKANDVALELDPITGQLRYHTVLVSVPRQAGKTNNACWVGTHRTLIQPGARVWYTAQTGQAARDRWIQEVATPTTRHLSALAKVKLGAGDTRLVIPETDAQFRPMPPTAEYLHGSQSDLCLNDEEWSRSQAEGAALLQAEVPTMNTRRELWPGPQLWFFSTAGDASSIWWHEMLDEAIDNPKSGVCVIDYGLSPDDDPTDLDLVFSKHPSAGEGLTMDGLIAARDALSANEFARAYGNIRTTGTFDIIDGADLEAIETMDPLDPGPVHIGVAVGWEQSCGAITSVGTIDGHPALEVIVHRPGTSWMEEAVDKIMARSDVLTVTIDDKGPAGRLAELLVSKYGDRITLASADDLVIATEHLLASAETRTIRLRANPDLRAELSGLRLRYLGDRGRMISRKTSLVSIARIEAGVLALRRAIGATPTPAAPPMIWSPA